MTTLIMYGFTCLNLMADEIKQPYTILRGDATLVVSDTPKFKTSEPIPNSFVYIDGEYIHSPYIITVTNLAVCINGRVVTNYEPWVNTREFYLPGRIGITPESVAQSIDSECESLVQNLTRGGTFHFYKGGKRSSGMDDGSGALALIGLAQKATKGDEQAKQTLIETMGLKNSLSSLHPDWIKRLANNKNLETRATTILEEKREREKQERERRDKPGN